MTPLTPTEIQQAIGRFETPDGLFYTDGLVEPWHFELETQTTEGGDFVGWEPSIIAPAFGIQLLANHIEHIVRTATDYWFETDGETLMLYQRDGENIWMINSWNYSCPLSRAIALIRASLEVKP